MNDDGPAEEVPGLEGLCEELEQALGQVRRATEELPPLEELAMLQETMAGLAQVGSVLGQMQLAVEQEAGALRRMTGRPDWCLEARVRLGRPGAVLAALEFEADFDLTRLSDDQDRAGGDMIHAKALPAAGLAVMRELRVRKTSTSGSDEDVEGGWSVVSAPYMPLELSADSELCMDLAPFIAAALSAGAPGVNLPAGLGQVRVPLDLFQEGQPFQHSKESQHMGLEFSAHLSFRPLGNLDSPL